MTQINNPTTPAVPGEFDNPSLKERLRQTPRLPWSARDGIFLVAAVALAAAGVVGGIICFIVGIVRFFTGGMVSGLMTVSIGLLLFAMGCLCTAALIFVIGQVFPWMIRGISNLLHNGIRRRKKVETHE